VAIYILDGASELSTSSCKFLEIEMKPMPRKEDLFTQLFGEATRRWGEETARELRSDIESVGEAIWQVESYEIKPEDEPSRPPRRAEA
jgi:hypothetical protein